MIAGDGLSPGVRVINSSNSNTDIPQKYEELLLPFVGKMSIVHLQVTPSALTWLLQILIPYTFLTRHLHQFPLPPVGRCSPPYFKGESEELCTCPSLSSSRIISHSFHFLTSKEKD